MLVIHTTWNQALADEPGAVEHTQDMEIALPDGTDASLKLGLP